VQFRNFIKGLSIIGLTLIVACQPLERPFQPESKTGLQTVPGPRAYLHVASIKNGPENLDTAVAEKLQELGIAAFAGQPVPDRYYVRGDLIDEGGLQFVQWTIFDPQDQNTGLYTMEKLPDLAQPSSAKPQTIDEFVLHSASNIDRLLGGDGVNFAELKKPILFVPIVKGAPGDGSESLAFAIQEELVRMGFEVLPTENGANYIVRGTATLSPAKAGSQIIKLTWSLERRNGEQVGQIQQRNRIKAGSLNGVWGPTASLAAKGGAQGVLKLLRSSEPEYFASKS
jgi:hypothetical protein